jgi:hypothetical protein
MARQRLVGRGRGRARALGMAFAAIGALALAAAGCGASRVPMRESTRSFTASDYGGIYGRWTRNADEFDFGRLGEILHVTATFESWEFRWAYVVRYAADHSFTTEERTRLLEESLADARQRHRFFVTLGGANWREGDLTGRQSDWRVLLVDPTGRQIEPVELTRIGRPSADQRTYFPSIQRQRHTFMIAFPTTHPDGTPAIPPDADHVVLRFAGSAGTVELRWEIEQSVPAGAPLDGN